MRYLHAIVFAVVSFATVVAWAQDAKNASALVESGFTAYMKGGPEAGIQAWIKGSGLEGNKQTLTQANLLRQIEDYYGKPESLEIIKEHRISERSRLLVFAMNFTKGITYARFQAYQTSSGSWVATEFRFFTDAASFLPEGIVYGK